jgi:starch-binding outer membrane protein, SusD/RagB family
MRYNTPNELLYFFRLKIFIGLILITQIGCKKFLEIPPPKTQALSSSIFSDNNTANAAILSIYSKMVNDRGFPYKLSLLTGLYSDELKNYSTTPETITFYANNLIPQNSFVQGDLWTPFYNFIYQSNTILENINNATNLPVNLRHQLAGEAKFVRAFCHFYLVNIFGDVPLITSTDYKINSVASRTSTSDVYKQIIADLKDAQSLLNENFVGVDGLTISSERVRPNKWAATALLARAYLYYNDPANAEIEASKLINQSSLFFLVANLANVFQKNSMETIWALQPIANGSFSTPEGASYNLLGPPSLGGIRNATISSNLLNTFATNDARITKWIGDSSGYKFPNKYKVISGSSLSEYSIVLRLAEQYLIRAEAKAQQNKLSEGLQDVNKIRNRAGLADTTATNKDELLDIILKERQLELFSEYGHRWFDIKRSGKVDAIMATVATQKGGTWSSYKKLFPIPQKELDNDPNLVQNSGY